MTYFTYDVYLNVVFIQYIKCEKGFLKYDSLNLFGRPKHWWHSNVHLSPSGSWFDQVFKHDGSLDLSELT